MADVIILKKTFYKDRQRDSAYTSFIVVKSWIVKVYALINSKECQSSQLESLINLDL